MGKVESASNPNSFGRRMRKIDEWEVKSAVDTLIKAEEIKKDDKLMKLVRAEIKKKKLALANVVEDVEEG